MKLIRQSFYLILGLTFPGFWVAHASGFAAVLYRPIQKITGTVSGTWPSLATAILVYLLAMALFECLYRVFKNAHP